MGKVVRDAAEGNEGAHSVDKCELVCATWWMNHDFAAALVEQPLKVRPLAAAHHGIGLAYLVFIHLTQGAQGWAWDGGGANWDVMRLRCEGAGQQNSGRSERNITGFHQDFLLFYCFFFFYFFYFSYFFF